MKEAAQVASFFCFMADFSIRALSLPDTIAASRSME
jgi:hypothetical protein